MFSNFINFSYKIGNDECIGYHIKNPNTLSSNLKLELFGILYPIALEAFKQDESENFSKDVYQHIFSYDNLAIIIKEGQPVAFRMWQVYLQEERKILYLAGMCVRTMHQGIGIGEGLLKYVMQLFQQESGSSLSDYIVMRTQNPIMKRCFDKAIGGISYPNGKKLPQHITEIGSYMAQILDCKNFDHDTLISRGVYSGSLYSTPPTKVNESMYLNVFNKCNIAQGDAIICIWECL
jgi:hypothetical protein